MNTRSDFNSIAAIIVFYFQQRNNLFADQLAQQKFGKSLESICEEIFDWTNTSPQDLAAVLERSSVKNAIERTATAMKNKVASHPEIKIEKMTDAELKNENEHLKINYSFYDSIFGRVVIASTKKGICKLAFSDKEDAVALDQLKNRFPQAMLRNQKDAFQKASSDFIDHKPNSNQVINLHIRGTDFQLQTWKKLIRIPSGGLMSYSKLTDDRKFSHALGAAVGANPVAYIIPCHRVVPATGEVGEYHWNSNRKAALICWEALRSGR